MGNRRTKHQPRRTPRAPRESRDHHDDAPPPDRRNVWQWSLLGIKVAVGLCLLLGVVGALSFGVLHYARTTPRFSVVDVRIEGTQRLLRQDVLAAAGLEKGTNLFALDVEATERRLLQSPWISKVRVTRRLPGTVRLEISEREAAAVALIEGTPFLVDRDGVPFKTLGRGDPSDLPLITGVTAHAFSKDRRAEQARVYEALVLLRDYERSSFARGLTAQEVHLESSGGAVLTVGPQGTALVLGLPPWKKKLLRAERVLERTRQRGGQPNVIFLDNDAHPERVVVRVK